MSKIQQTIIFSDGTCSVPDESRNNDPNIDTIVSQQILMKASEPQNSVVTGEKTCNSDLQYDSLDEVDCPICAKKVCVETISLVGDEENCTDQSQVVIIQAILGSEHTGDTCYVKVKLEGSNSESEASTIYALLEVNNGDITLSDRKVTLSNGQWTAKVNYKE
jgi:hypothetical protein